MSLVRINRHPSRRQLVVFGAAWLIFLSAIAFSLWLKHRPIAAETVGAAALVVPALGAVFPRGLAALYVGLSYATFPIGWVVSHAVLAVIYFLVLTPLGWLMRLGGYNPLARGFVHTAPSYWRARPPEPKPETYLRQS